MNTESVPNIKRIDHNYTHGWQVHIQSHGETHARFFADIKHGGKEKAFAKAQEKKWEFLAKHPPADGRKNRTEPHYFHNAKNNSSTPVVGVYRTMKEMSSGKKYPYYETIVQVPGSAIKHRSRSIYKWGAAIAFLEMARFRRGWLREIYGNRFREDEFNKSVIKHYRQIKL